MDQPTLGCIQLSTLLITARREKKCDFLFYFIRSRFSERIKPRNKIAEIESNSTFMDWWLVRSLANTKPKQFSSSSCKLDTDTLAFFLNRIFNITKWSRVVLVTGLSEELDFVFNTVSDRTYWKYKVFPKVMDLVIRLKVKETF